MRSASTAAGGDGWDHQGGLEDSAVRDSSHPQAFSRVGRPRLGDVNISSMDLHYD
jgi:hypothetical protein